MATSRYRIERDRDVSGPTELRIHGVGAAPPERMLDAEDPVLVAGDATAGFYRAVSEDDPPVEAYSWGGLTSRGSGIRGLKKALWVFLLPYALLNTARFMLPGTTPRKPHKSGKPRRNRGRWVTRGREVLIDLLSYIATAGGFGLLYAITVDGIGLNCLLREQPTPCARRLGLGWFSDIEWFVNYPSRMIVISVLPALIALIAFGLLGRSSQKNFNFWARVPKQHDKSADDDEAAEPLLMGDLGIWTNLRRSTRLRRLHMAGALAFLSVAMAFPIAEWEKVYASFYDVDWEWPDALFLSSAAGIVVFVLAGLLTARRTPKRRRATEDEPEDEDHAARDFPWWLRFVSYGILAVTVVAGLGTAQPSDDFDPRGTLVYQRFGAGNQVEDGLARAIRVVQLGQPPGPRFYVALEQLIPEEFDFPRVRRPNEEALQFWRELQEDPLDVLSAKLDRFLDSLPTKQDIRQADPLFRLLDNGHLYADFELTARRHPQLGNQYLEDVAGRGGGWYFWAFDITAISLMYDVLAWAIAMPLVFFLTLLLALMFVRPRNLRDGALGMAPPLIVVFGLLVGFLGLVSLSRWLFVYLDASLSNDFIEASIGLLLVGTLAFFAAILVAALSLLWVAIGRRRRLRAANNAYWTAASGDLGEAGETDPLAKPDWLEDQGLSPPESRRLWSMQIDPDRKLGGDRWLTALDRVTRLGRLEKWAILPLAVAAIVPMALIFMSDLTTQLAYHPLMQGLALLVSLVYIPLLVLVVWRSTRIGHLWDVLTFWPRWGHPFAPPGYAHRAIPEISTRLKYRLGEAPVIVAGHSQGSVLAAAVVAGLPPSRRQNVALMTYGSPLTRLYQRFFPRYFGEDQLQRLADSLTRSGTGKPRWRNIYRRSDPIGWPIFAKVSHHDEIVFSTSRQTGEIDVAAPDPWPRPAPRTGDPLPAVAGHSEYERDPPYRRARLELWHLLGVIHDEEFEESADTSTTEAPIEND